MGNALSSAKDNAKQELSNAVIKSKLIDIRAAKRQRDSELAFRIATVRERCHWLAAFYVTLLAFNAAKVRIAKEKWSPLPLAWLPFIATPYVFLYQLDFSYGNKLERLNIESQHILRNEHHFFKMPMRLPRSFEAVYREMLDEQKRAEGKDIPDWAVFDDSVTNEEIMRGTLPVTQLFLPPMSKFSDKDS